MIYSKIFGFCLLQLANETRVLEEIGILFITPLTRRLMIGNAYPLRYRETQHGMSEKIEIK